MRSTRAALESNLDYFATYIYIDDLKIFAASESKLNGVLTSMKTAMEDIGLQWNLKKCSVVHMKRGVQVCDESNLKLSETMVIMSIKYKSIQVPGCPRELVARRKVGPGLCCEGVSAMNVSNFVKPPLGL